MNKVNEFLKNDGKAWGFLSGYLLLFILFIVLPVLFGVGMSLTNFNGIQAPNFVGFRNYIDLFTRDQVFMQHIIPNTFQFALIAGVGGYVLAFIIAWILAQIQRLPRTILAIIIYSPSLTSGVVMTVIWRALFSGDQQGHLNHLLMNIGVIDAPIQFLQSPEHLLTIMVIVTVWNSMGIGFLAMLSGILNVNEELYEAGAIDGIKNRIQEVIHITIPSMKPQMLFGAVMAVVNTFNVSRVGVELTGQNPTPEYAGQLIVNHIEDHGFIRFELGYAAAISVVLLIFVYYISKLAFRAFADKD